MCTWVEGWMCQLRVAGCDSYHIKSILRLCRLLTHKNPLALVTPFLCAPFLCGHLILSFLPHGTFGPPVGCGTTPFCPRLFSHWGLSPLLTAICIWLQSPPSLPAWGFVRIVGHIWI